MVQRIGQSLIATTLASLPMLLYFLYVTVNWTTGDLGPETQGWLVVMLPLAFGAVFLPWAAFALAVSASLSFRSWIVNIAGVAAILIALFILLPTLNASYCVNPSYQSRNECIPPTLLRSLLFFCAASGVGAILLNQFFRRKRAQHA